MQICPDLARLMRQWKDLEFGTSAAAPSGAGGEIEGDIDDGTAAPLSYQGATPLLAPCRCRMQEDIARSNAVQTLAFH
jgi:hypothetical protein